MTIKLLTEQHFEFLSLKGGRTGSSEFTLVKIPHCWKSHVAAQISMVLMLPLDNTYIVIYWTNIIFYLLNEHQLAIISF